MGYVGFVLFDCLIHLLWSKFATILGYLGVQKVSYFLVDSVHGDLILEGLQLFVCQFILPILPQVAHGGAYPYQKVYGSLPRLLVEILYSISLLPEGERPTIVFPQHLKESSQILSIPRIETANPVEHIGSVSHQRGHYQGHEV